MFGSFSSKLDGIFCILGSLGILRLFTKVFPQTVITMIQKNKLILMTVKRVYNNTIWCKIFIHHGCVYYISVENYH